MNEPQKSTAADPYAPWRFRDFRLILCGSVLANIGRNMLSVAVGWEIAERLPMKEAAMAMAWVGLARALPIILFAMPAGQLADRLERRKIVVFSEMLLTGLILWLAWLSHVQAPLSLFYVCLFLAGISHAFNGAASASLLPQTVPPEIFSRAITWKSSAFQVACVGGPALGGLLLGTFGRAQEVFATSAVLYFVYAVTVFFMSRRPVTRATEPVTLRTLAAGFHFVWNDKIILATITLDLFAVLLGGATALLPLYAKHILHVGPTELGWLVAAPAVGAFCMAIALAHLPPSRNIGKQLLWAVAGFGVATIIFGLSQWLWLSLLALFLTGALDNISVVVRHSLVQLRTPDAMRGRVSAVNNVFISSSNELGAFESGLVAKMFSPVISVVSGGIGTIVVVLLTACVWPEIAKLKSLHETDPKR